MTMALPSPFPRYFFRGDMDCVHCILFDITSNTELLYAGTNRGKVHVWNLYTNREMFCFASGEDSCLSLLNLNDHLFVQHKCGLIKVYKKTESEWINYRSTNVKFYHYCRFQIFSETAIFVPLEEATVGILSTNTLKVDLKLKPPEDSGDVMVIKPLQKRKLVLVGYENGKLILWDVRQNRILNSLTVAPCPMGLDFDDISMRGIIGGPSEYLQLFTVSNNLLQQRPKITITNPGISAIAIRPDSKIVASGGWDSRVRLFSWKTLKPLAVLDNHKDIVQDVTFSTKRIQSYDNKYLMATAAKDGYVGLWDIYPT